MAESTVIKVNGTEEQDPDAAIVRHFDWSAWFATESTGVIASTTVVVAPTVADADADPVTIDQVSLLTGNRKVQFRAQGGTAGRKYKVTCHILTDESPVQQDDRSFYLKIKEK